jgi:hypothetical protein
MYSILRKDDAPDLPVGFWRRQFLATSTTRQLIFDVVFGALMPILCFYLDPGIIRGNLSASILNNNLSILNNNNLFIYSFSALAIVTLLFWLVFGHRMGSAGSFTGGVLLSAATLSFAIGVIIFPMALLGLVVLIGALGFIPLLTAFVYLRNAVRAIESAVPHFKEPVLAAVLLLGVLTAVGLPVLAQWQIVEIARRSMYEILGQDPVVAEAAVQRIKYIGFVVDADPIVRVYRTERDQSRRERLAKAYREITGDDIEERLVILKIKDGTT